MPVDLIFSQFHPGVCLFILEWGSTKRAYKCNIIAFACCPGCYNKDRTSHKSLSWVFHIPVNKKQRNADIFRFILVWIMQPLPLFLIAVLQIPHAVRWVQRLTAPMEQCIITRDFFSSLHTWPFFAVPLRISFRSSHELIFAQTLSSISW